MSQQTPGLTTERPTEAPSTPTVLRADRLADMAAPPTPSAAFPENGWHEVHGTPVHRPHNQELLRDGGAFMERWTSIQTTFVDEPRRAVEQADTLVGEVIKERTRVFAGERHRLEAGWSCGEAVSTEDLRRALQKYRDFLQTLLRN